MLHNAHCTSPLSRIVVLLLHLIYPVMHSFIHFAAMSPFSPIYLRSSWRTDGRIRLSSHHRWYQRGIAMPGRPSIPVGHSYSVLIFQGHIYCGRTAMRLVYTHTKVLISVYTSLIYTGQANSNTDSITCLIQKQSSCINPSQGPVRYQRV